MKDKSRLVEIVGRFKDKKLLIVGDAIADRFLFGSINRVSREAPVFILRHEQTETVPGGAANCAVNLASLGADVTLVAVIGNDEAGEELLKKLGLARVNLDGIVRSDKVQTTTKVRILAGQTHSNRQQVIRIDYEGEPLASTELHQEIGQRIAQRLGSVDAVVISDYNYGVVSDNSIDQLRQFQQNTRRPVLVDSRFQLGKFAGFTAATPNEDEVEQHTGKNISSAEELESIGTELKQSLGFEALLVTRGANGMMLWESANNPVQIAAVGALQAVDVTGAGDTVIATFALSLASEATYSEAAQLANHAGGLVVMKRGTASITAKELEQSILNG
jgi:rfaE bifunctional protein kinase chain/domain